MVAPPGPATEVAPTEPVPATLEEAVVPPGVTAPACCWVPVPGPAGLAPANWKLLGVKAAQGGEWRPTRFRDQAGLLPGQALGGKH